MPTNAPSSSKNRYVPQGSWERCRAAARAAGTASGKPDQSGSTATPKRLENTASLSASAASQSSRAGDTLTTTTSLAALRAAPQADVVHQDCGTVRPHR